MTHQRDILARAGIVLPRANDGEHRTTCPRCSHLRRKARDACLAVRIDAEGVTWFCHHCGWKAGARTHTPHVRAATPRPHNGDTTQQRALALWHEARPLTATPADIYLRTRGLQGHDTPALRFHPRCPRGPATRRPAMLALFTDLVTGKPCGLHRTYLKADGSAKDDTGPQKMMLGRAGGAAIRLVPDEAVTTALGVCEGIETGLTIRAAGYLVWVVGSAGAIASFPRLGGLQSLSIFADHDPTGLAAAQSCARRLVREGLEVRIVCPRQAGTDFNDLLKASPHE